MKPLHRLLNFLFIGILLLACEDEQQTWLSEMEGTPDCTVPAVIGKGLPVTITAGGIITPGNVAYTWSAPKFSPETFTGTTFEAIAPGEACDECYIFITAHSAGYHDVTIKKKVTVLECIPMQGHLDIVVPADVVKGETVQFIAMGITSPAEENVTYHWSALSFTPNSYTGTIFETTAPSQDRIYTVTVTAQADNYCDTSMHKTIEVKPGRKMIGTTFTFDAFPEAMVGERVTFVPRGITTPTAENISYRWVAPAFDSGSGTPTPSGNSYTTICPPIAGTYTVEVTASATGYSDSTIKRENIIVLPRNPMGGDISFTYSPAEVVTSQQVTFRVTNEITNPTKDISFVWDAPGFSPDTYTGNTFTATAPATTVTPIVTVTAKASRYEDKKASAIVTVKGGKGMGGTLDFHVPDQIVKDLPAAFTISSKPTAGELPITYEWDAPGFSPDTYTGNTFTGTPTIAGQRTVTLRAIANGYTTVSKSKTVTVSPGLNMEELTISASSDSPFNAGINTVTFTPSFTDLPISPVTYTWEAANCNPDPFTGNSYKPTLPSVAGTYEIKLTASATGYLPKQASFTYTIACNQMPIGINLTRTKLLIDDETTLNVNPTVPGASYTWDIPTGFTITAGSSITPLVTIQSTVAQEFPVTLTLNAEAVNYCPASYTATVTVKECYPLPNLPEITASLDKDDNGIVIVPARRNVTFSTQNVTPWRTGGTTTYNWIFRTSSYPFTPENNAPGSSSNIFTATAPNFNAEEYTLALRVKSDGYCDHTPNSIEQKVKIAPYTEQLRGDILLDEAITDEANQKDGPVVWIAKGRATTLHATYVPAPTEDNIKISYSWTLMDNNNNYNTVTSANSDKGTLEFTPPNEVINKLIIVTAIDENGRKDTMKTFRYTVQNCAYTGSDLYVNVNWPCGNTAAGMPMFRIKDAADDKIYKVVNIRGKWWFAENLKRITPTSVQYSTFTELGRFYEYQKDTPETPEAPGNHLLSDMHDPTKGVACPVGWKIPDQADWLDLRSIATELVRFKLLANSASAPSESTANATTWVRYQNASYTNEYEFSALPGGYLVGGEPSLQGRAAYFMTYGADVWYLGNTSGGSISNLNGVLESDVAHNGQYYNIRCVRDF